MGCMYCAGCTEPSRTDISVKILCNLNLRQHRMFVYLGSLGLWNHTTVQLSISTQWGYGLLRYLLGDLREVNAQCFLLRPIQVRTVVVRVANKSQRSHVATLRFDI